MMGVLVIVCLAYAGIQLFELAAVLGRVSGIVSNSVMLGYSLQQSVYMLTRLMLVILLPVIGFLVDQNITIDQYQALTHIALLLATIFGIGIAYNSARIVRYFNRVIYYFGKENYGYLRAFSLALFDKSECGKNVAVRRNFLKIEFTKRYPWRLLILSNIVFSIYSVGVFVSFYFALVFHDYRASISQMSGLANAFGAVIITFYIEPRISRAIDSTAEDADIMVGALFIGRLMAIGITGQLMLLLVYVA